MAEADVDPSPVRAAHMFRCPVCDAKGRTGTTLGFGGTPCSLCQGRCYLKREPTACPSCDAKGGFASLFGLKWNTCRLCHGVRYLIEKPFPCPKCRATGLVKGYGGIFSSPCDLCDRQRYLKHIHGRCIKCNFSSTLAKFFRKCTNCTGIGQYNNRWREGAFPVGTFLANVCGSLVMGLIYYGVTHKYVAGWSGIALAAFQGGFLGSLTTMSSFMSEVVGHREKHSPFVSYSYLAATAVAAQVVVLIVGAVLGD